MTCLKHYFSLTEVFVSVVNTSLYLTS